MPQVYYFIITYMMISSGVYSACQSFDRDSTTLRNGLISFAIVFLCDITVVLLRTKYTFMQDILMGWAYAIPVFVIGKGHLLAKIFVFISHYFLCMCIFMFSSFFGEIFFPYQTTGQLIITLVLSTLLFLGWCLLCKKYAYPLSDRLFIFTNARIWAIYILIPCVSLVIMGYFISTGISWYPKPFGQTLPYLATPLFMMLCYVLLLFTIISAHDKMLATREIDLAHSTIVNARNHYDQLTALVEDIQRQRHDNRFHMNAIKKLLTDGNIEEALRYLDTKASHDEKIHIKRYCLNPIINALLSSLDDQCRQSGIKFDTEIILPSTGEIDEYELCAILGNLLENAVIAANHTPKDRFPYVTLTMRPNKKAYGIVVENSYDGHVITNKGKLLSTKSNGGGLGISSIKAIAKRYDGHYTADYDEKKFTAYVVLKLANS